MTVYLIFEDSSCIHWGQWQNSCWLNHWKCIGCETKMSCLEMQGWTHIWRWHVVLKIGLLSLKWLILWESGVLMNLRVAEFILKSCLFRQMEDKALQKAWKCILLFTKINSMNKYRPHSLKFLIFSLHITFFLKIMMITLAKIRQSVTD